MRMNRKGRVRGMVASLAAVSLAGGMAHRGRVEFGFRVDQHERRRRSGPGSAVGARFRVRGHSAVGRGSPALRIRRRIRILDDAGFGHRRSRQLDRGLDRDGHGGQRVHPAGGPTSCASERVVGRVAEHRVRGGGRRSPVGGHGHRRVATDLGPKRSAGCVARCVDRVRVTGCHAEGTVSRDERRGGAARSTSRRQHHGACGPRRRRRGCCGWGRPS